MKATLHRRASLLAALAACVLALLVGAFPAQAKDLAVSGADSYQGYASDGTNQTDPNALTLLTATGDEGALVYVNVTDASGKVLASHMPLQLAKGQGFEGGDATAYKLSVSLPNGYDGATYTVEAYADRAQVQKLFQGTCTPVYARLEGVDQPVLIGSYTAGEGESREFAAPTSLDYQGSVYTLSGTETPNATYTYSLTADAAESVDVTVTYVRPDGSTIKTATLGTLSKGQSSTFGLEGIFTVGEGADATSWLPTNFSRSLQASYPGTHDFVITCQPAGSAATPSSYVAQIGLQTADGQTLASDRLSVYGTYTYTFPTTVYQRDDNGSLVSYKLSKLAEDDKASKLDVETGVLSLNSEADGLQGTQAFTAVYDPQPSDASLTFTLKCVCYDPDSVGANGRPNTYTETHTAEVTAENTKDNPATIQIPGAISWNGKAYVPANMPSGGVVTYAFGSGDYPVTTVYYVPEGYQPAKSYQVQVQYKNVANKSVVRTDTVDVTPDMTQDLTISVTSQFMVGGETYVLLKGSPTSISHGYYTPYRIYTVWCRNVNDTIYENATVVTNRVEYYDGGTVVVPGATTTTPGITTGTTGTAGTAGTTGTEGTPSSSAAIPNAGDVTTVVSPDGTATTVNSEGQDLSTERITDEATPLASGAEGQAAEAGGGVSPVAVGLGIAAAVAAGLVILFLVRRKKQQEESGSKA